MTQCVIISERGVQGNYFLLFMIPNQKATAKKANAAVIRIARKASPERAWDS